VILVVHAGRRARDGPPATRRARPRRPVLGLWPGPGSARLAGPVHGRI